jgi:dipeptidyl aminopeptidase/acylaminoacyl peptidase
MRRSGFARWSRTLLLACAPLACMPHAHALVPTPLDFARHSSISEVSMSPDGHYVALAVPSDNGMETELRILRIDGSEGPRVLKFGKQQHVADVYWTTDRQLVLARAKTEPLRAAPLSYGQLFSSDIDGKEQHVLFGYFADDGSHSGRRKDHGYAEVVDVLDGEPGKVLVSFRCWDCGEEPDTVIFKVDTVTGSRREIERADGSVRFVFDNAGVPRIRVGSDDNDIPVVAYRPTPTSQWQPMPKAMVGHSIGGGRFAADNDTLYAAVFDDGGPSRMYRLRLSTGAREKLAGADDVDIGGYEFGGRGGVPYAVVYDAGAPGVEYLDPDSEWSALHAGLMKAFPGQLVSLESFSRDNRKVLFSARADRQPVNFYVFDRDTHKMTVVAESRPWLKPEQLAPSRAIEFQSRDGRKLFGFYTARDDTARPLVVIPHGGPHGVYDTWGYDPDAQFFASRGYGVLQVNFRGSGGRGQAFERAGYREWGGKVQDDISDGVKWLVANHLADPGRICTFGASFGGYAAMMQPIRNPGMYRCAVGYVGVYDLAIMKKEGDIPGTRWGRRYLDRVLGSDDEALAAASPARNVDKVGVPVFLAQGRIDRRVPMDQFRALTKAFAATGVKVETMVVPGEGHGFYKPENQAELYRRADAFISANTRAE